MEKSSKSKALQILLVEDHALTREWLQRLLQSKGHVVQTADSFSNAVTKLQEVGFDVLISDIGLPDGSGLDLLATATMVREPYAVVLSGYDCQADKERSKSAGFLHHLVKPIGATQLDDILTAARQARDSAGNF